MNGRLTSLPILAVALGAAVPHCAVVAAAAAQPRSGQSPRTASRSGRPWPGASFCARPRVIQIKGLQMAYREAGQGKPLLLLHGGGLSSESWQRFASTAARSFRVIAVDSRGHGRTANPEGKVSYDLLAADIAGFVRAMGIEKPLIVGYSDGGIVGLTLARANPGLARALVVAGAAPVVRDLTHYKKGLKTFFATQQPGVLRGSALAQLASRRPAMVEAYQKRHRAQGRSSWRKLLRDFWPMWSQPLGYERQDLAGLEVPTLVLLGEKDEFFRVEEARRLARWLPKGELAIAKGASHTFFRDAPKRFGDMTMRFLLREQAPEAPDPSATTASSASHQREAVQ